MFYFEALEILIKAVFVLTSNHFRKCFSVNTGVWLHKENIFSGNYLKLTRKMSLWPRKWFEAQIFTSNHFWVRRAKREGERERESARARGRQITPSTSPAKPRSSFPGPTIARYSPTIERKPRSYAPVRQSHAPVRRSRGSPDRTLQSDDRSRLRSRCSISPPRNLGLDPPISLCDFDFCCCCVVVW